MIRFFDGLLAVYGSSAAPKAVNENRRDRGDMWLSVAAYRAIDALGRVRGNGRANDNHAANAA
ncbi:MAG: hypothetical protein SGJ07_17630 [Rhodospirillaceae bacterium]|nr:hypothetical protein [Rhodospirillaceae bacterium]